MNGKMALWVTAALLFVVIPVSVGHAKTTHPQSPQTQPQNQTFIGEVTRSTDARERQTPFIIYDQTRKMNYFLDDNGNNNEVGQYNSREVQVTGTLERNTIHVKSIKKL